MRPVPRAVCWPTLSPMPTSRRVLPLMIVSGVLAAGCAGAAPVAMPDWTRAPLATASVDVASLVVDVYKSPTCGCCGGWEEYLGERGVSVRSIPTEDMSALKLEHGLPPETWSCHTAFVDGYLVEGHVPLEAIEDLLTERPAIDGIALPGMPSGSPGMTGEQEAPFEVVAIDDGAVSAFGS
jgi:hypothetical protein